MVADKFKEWAPLGSHSLYLICIFRALIMAQARLLCPWILQARILEGVAVPFSRGSSQPRDPTHVSHIAGGFFTVWATREARYSRYSYRKTVIGKKRASHGDCLCVKEEGNRPSWLHLEKEGNSILHFQWLLIMCLVATGITYLQLNWPPGLINTRFHTKISHRQERSNPQCSQSPLYLYSNRWCRLQSITSWPFWLWIMDVTWLYLPLTLSRLGLRNLGMWAWAIHLRYIRFSQKSVGVLG